MSPSASPSMYGFELDPVEELYKISGSQAEPFQRLAVISNFENLLLLTADASSIFTAQTLLASVVTSRQYVFESLVFNTGSADPGGLPEPGRYLVSSMSLT